METYNPTASTPSGQNLFELQVDHQSMSYLNETARWGKFLSIVGFIFSGLILVMAFFIGKLLASVYGLSGEAGPLVGMGGTFITVIYIALAILMFFPALFLFRFSGKMQNALRNNDQINFNEALGQMKSYFKFWGIVTIVYLSICVVGFLMGIIGAMMR